MGWAVSLMTICGWAFLTTGCAKSCSQSGQARSHPAVAAAAETSLSSKKGAGPEQEGTFADAIRRHDFQTAARLIDALPEKKRKAPEVRYARARVALELNDVETALEQVTGLAEEAPAFEDLVRQVVLEAARQTLDVTVLEHLLGADARRGASEDRLVLILAYEAGGQERRALDGLSDMIRDLKAQRRLSSREDDLLARAVRKRADLLVRLEQEALAAADFRWLAIHAPSHSAARHADQLAERLDKERPLTKDERFHRAQAFSESGQVPMTEEELRRMDQASGPPPPEEERLATLAWAVYTSRTDYQRAAQLFSQAAQEGGPDRKKHLYYAAKSRARAHQHQQAIAGYRDLIGKGGSYAQHASYQTPRLLFIDGKWKEAVEGYQAHLRRYRGGIHSSSAVYQLAVARLATGDFTAAQKDFSKLVRRADGPRERARLLELLAVAFEGTGNWKKAKALYEQVIEDRPLSLPALLAAARLRAQNAAVPPPLPPAKQEKSPASALAPRLPDLAARLHRVGLDHEAERALETEEHAIREKYGRRGFEALCQLYGKLALATRRYQIAQTAASWETLSREPTKSNRWQWNCIYPEPHLNAVQREATKRDVPPAFIYAVMRQESAFRPKVVSPADAVGLMQIIPPTARKIAMEIGSEYEPELMRVPAINIRFGAYYLRRLLDIFGDRFELAAASYNAGPRAVSSWLEAGDALPLDVFIARIPYRQTRHYVYRVMGNLARYQYLDKGEPLQLSLEIPSGLKAPEGAY